MRHASLFSGIGGFDLAAEWMGWENALSCEFAEFPASVLRHYFPSAHHYGDIRQLDGTKYRGTIDVLTGGFPCQPFSAAGKRRGTEDNRFLWPEMLRVIREIRPTWIVAENVRGLLSIEGGLVFERVCSELEEAGYEVQPICIPACAVGAPHKRERIWFIAHNANARAESMRGEKIGFSRHEQTLADSSHVECKRRECEGSSGRQSKAEIGNRNSNVTDSNNKRLEGRTQTGDSFGGGKDCHEQLGRCSRWSEPWIQAATRLCRVDDGLPRELDGITVPKWRKESLKAYGNAIVPAVALRIFEAIATAEGQLAGRSQLEAHS